MILEGVSGVFLEKTKNRNSNKIGKDLLRILALNGHFRRWIEKFQYFNISWKSLLMRPWNFGFGVNWKFWTSSLWLEYIKFRFRVQTTPEVHVLGMLFGP